MRGIRQHVNPLGAHFLAARALPIGIPERFERVEVELGCADAQFSFELAHRHPTWLVIGLDIRETLLDSLERRAARTGLTNLAFGYVNLNVDLDRVFAPGTVDRFHLLFPDPWFKARHRKRRVVESGLLEVAARQLRTAGELHFASDVFDLAVEAMSELEEPETGALGLHNLAGAWCFTRDNPCDAASRREAITIARGQRVWRMRYLKR